jgi:5,10-methylenetetrahydromethanopterin reductase
MTSPFQLGVLMLGRRPGPRIADLARVAERSGFDYFWIPDERFFREVYGLCTAAALATERLVIGPCVTDPYTRHPALTAAAIATLDELSEGRAVLGIGAGISGFQALGLEHRQPAVAVAEAVDLIRRLLRGEHARVRGQVVAFDGELDFTPARPGVPIYVAAGGPVMQRLAGRLADGVIIQSCLTEVEIDDALEHVRSGARSADRAPRTLDLVARVDVAVDASLDRAYEALRSRVARILLRQSPHFPRLRRIGLEVPKALVELTAGRGYTHDPAVLGPIAAEIPKELIDPFCIAATPAGLGERLARLLSYEFTQIVVVPIPTDGDRVEPVIEAVQAWRGGQP